MIARRKPLRRSPLKRKAKTEPGYLSKRRTAKRRAKTDAYRLACAEVDVRDRKVCCVCRAWSQRPHHHHVIPRSRGGGDHPRNLVTLCWECHRKHHDAKLAEVESARLRARGEAVMALYDAA